MCVPFSLRIGLTTVFSCVMFFVERTGFLTIMLNYMWILSLSTLINYQYANLPFFNFLSSNEQLSDYCKISLWKTIILDEMFCHFNVFIS